MNNLIPNNLQEDDKKYLHDIYNNTWVLAVFISDISMTMLINANSFDEAKEKVISGDFFKKIRTEYIKINLGLFCPICNQWSPQNTCKCNRLTIPEKDRIRIDTMIKFGYLSLQKADNFIL